MDLSPKIKEIKAKINKWSLIRHKSFCTAKETTNKMKRQPTKWGKIFANDMTDKGLISNICKQLIQLNTEKKKNPQLKMDRNEHFSKEEMHLANRHMKCKLNIANHQGNANQNHNEISPHTCQNGYHQRDHRTSYHGSVVMNSTSIHEDLGLIPGLTQWVRYLALPSSMV